VCGSGVGDRAWPGKVRLKPDATYGRLRVRLKPDATYAVLLALITIVTIGCEASYPASPTPTVESLEVQYRSSMGPARVGGSVWLIPYAVRSDGAWLDVSHSVTWSSSDPSIVRADSDVVVALAPGTASIIASYEGISGSLELDVLPNQPSSLPTLFLQPATPRALGETLSARAQWSEGGLIVTTSATWSSSDPSVATVDAHGVVIARAPGTVRIAAAYQGVMAWYVYSVPPPR
jgi:hypothetical protein